MQIRERASRRGDGEEGFEGSVKEIRRDAGEQGILSRMCDRAIRRDREMCIFFFFFFVSTMENTVCGFGEARAAARMVLALGYLWR